MAEKKYIDTDAFGDSLLRNAKHFKDKEDVEYVGMLVLIEPAADVEKVVRCKDCINSEFVVCDYYCCRHDCRMDGNGFCSFGAKKDK